MYKKTSTLLVVFRWSIKVVKLQLFEVVCGCFLTRGWWCCPNPKWHGSFHSRQAYGFRAGSRVSWKVWKCSWKTDHYQGLRRWHCPCSGANFIRCTTMVRKHSILFAGQICHPWGRQMSAMHFVENNIIDPVLPHSYRFSSNANSISKRPSQWLI